MNIDINGVSIKLTQEQILTKHREDIELILGE